MLKLQYLGYLMQRTDSFKKTLMLGKIEGRRRSGQQRMSWLESITDSNVHGFEQTSGDSERQGSLACCSLWDYKKSDMKRQLNNNKRGKWPITWEI